MNGARFRLGSTSYVYPGDLVHNARYLAQQIDDIELVLFDSAFGSNIPNARTVARLADIARDNSLTYTVHLPFDLPTRLAEQEAALARIAHLEQLMQPLTPYAYVFHVESARAGEDVWTEGAIRGVQALAVLGSSPSQWALENLESYPPEYLEPIYATVPVCRALDIGHLWKAERDALPTLESWLPQTRVIHLHGLHEIDHLSLRLTPPYILDPVIERLCDWSGVLTLEVFEDDFFSSRDALHDSLERIRR